MNLDYIQSEAPYSAPPSTDFKIALRTTSMGSCFGARIAQKWG